MVIDTDMDSDDAVNFETFGQTKSVTVVATSLI